jgi:hypothetical protein
VGLSPVPEAPNCCFLLRWLGVEEWLDGLLFCFGREFGLAVEGDILILMIELDYQAQSQYVSHHFTLP